MREKSPRHYRSHAAFVPLPLSNSYSNIVAYEEDRFCLHACQVVLRASPSIQSRVLSIELRIVTFEFYLAGAASGGQEPCDPNSACLVRIAAAFKDHHRNEDETPQFRSLATLIILPLVESFLICL
jgi:hypothetical protein